MTTPWAAGSASHRRILLGIVVPVVYLLALTCAVLAGRGTARAEARPVELSRAAARTVHVAARARQRRPRRLAPGVRSRAREGVEGHRARLLSIVAPTRVDTPVVSRSAIRGAVIRLAEPAPFVVRISSITTPATMQAAINECDGPVAIDWSADPSRWGVHPMEIAEHDYCGGAAFTSLATGRRVQVIGGGLSGVYVVDGLRRFVPSGAWASELDGLGDIALQTCVTDGMILVGLDRIG